MAKRQNMDDYYQLAQGFDMPPSIAHKIYLAMPENLEAIIVSSLTLKELMMCPELRHVYQDNTNWIFGIPIKVDETLADTIDGFRFE